MKNVKTFILSAVAAIIAICYARFGTVDWQAIIAVAIILGIRGIYERYYKETIKERRN